MSASHCNRTQRLQAKTALSVFNSAIASFSRSHEQCQPKADKRGKSLPFKVDSPCLVCGLEFADGEGKVPLYCDDELRPYYAHLGCADKVTGYLIGHHNIAVRGAGEWLYFWRGECGTARNKAEAGLLLDELCNRMITNGFAKANWSGL